MKNKLTKAFFLKALKAFLGLMAFSAFFIVGLTFNFIGRNIINVPLILGFSFSFLSFLAHVLAIWLHHYKYLKLTLKFRYSILIFDFFAIALGIIGIIFGTIGYLLAH